MHAQKLGQSLNEALTEDLHLTNEESSSQFEDYSDCLLSDKCKNDDEITIEKPEASIVSTLEAKDDLPQAKLCEADSNEDIWRMFKNSDWDTILAAVIVEYNSWFPDPEVGWTDEFCIKEALSLCEWKEIPENDIEGHLVRFINLWFSDDKIEPEEINIIIRNVLLMFPLGACNELLFKNVFDSAIETAQVPTAVDSDKNVIKDPVVDDLDYENKANVIAFHNWLKENLLLLKATDTDTSYEGAQISMYNSASYKLRTVLGFCALILMRLIVRKESHVKQYFPYKAWKIFDRLFPDVRLTIALVAPSANCLKLASDALNKNSKNKGRSLFHLLIFEYTKNVIDGGESESAQFVRQILQNGCLKFMEGNGIGLVTMFQDIKLLYKNIDERQLLSFITNSENDTQSRERLIKFLDIYMQQEKPQYSWKWARILFEDIFRHLNIHENKSVCSKLAALLINKRPGIFQHKDLKTDNPYASASLKWAKYATKKLIQLNNQRSQD
ncbi:uncharacterized protein LOC124406550 [Diprion similis]|uniref:uncharacterized protein LOC124406550 n=1 Tax=Diprion similis TaxID=362088 RepID=UPI001EF96D4C|nr:uncharacterized protein LOC124406550 [Diprion similis]